MIITRIYLETQSADNNGNPHYVIGVLFNCQVTYTQRKKMLGGKKRDNLVHLHTHLQAAQINAKPKIAKACVSTKRDAALQLLQNSAKKGMLPDPPLNHSGLANLTKFQEIKEIQSMAKVRRKIIRIDEEKYITGTILD